MRQAARILQAGGLQTLNPKPYTRFKAPPPLRKPPHVYSARSPQSSQDVLMGLSGPDRALKESRV